MVVGKVVMRIPWIGHIILFMRNSLGLPVIILLMVLLVIIEFILPLFRKKKPVATPAQLENDASSGTQMYLKSEPLYTKVFKRRI